MHVYTVRVNLSKDLSLLHLCTISTRFSTFLCHLFSSQLIRMVHLSTVRLIRSRGPPRFWKKKFVFDQTQHFYGRRRNCYSIAIRAVQKAWRSAYIGRLIKKTEIRKLWNLRISSGLKEHGITYNPFMANLLKYNIQLDRKILSNLAITEPKTFKCLAELGKTKHNEGLLAAVRANPDRVLQRLTTQEDLLESVKKLRLDADKQSSTIQTR